MNIFLAKSQNVLMSLFLGVLICVTFVLKNHVFTLYKRRFQTETEPEPFSCGTEQQKRSTSPETPVACSEKEK